eukprot:m.485577 g.485577  ORF g.485577 m.485577 type:complete len:172 (+) comp57209_c0_seq1:73-588(+)
MHLWECGSVHSAATLGGPAALHPSYTMALYTQDIIAASPTKKVVGAVYVEAIPADPLAEAVFAQHNVDTDPAHCLKGIVAHADLTSPDVEGLLASMQAQCPALRGIRQILNWEPTWPHVFRGDYLESADFERGYALLEKYGLSFDLHCNPYQPRRHQPHGLPLSQRRLLTG